MQIHLAEGLDDAAAKEAARRGISKAALIRRALAAEVTPDVAAGGDPWEAMIGWLDSEPIDDIDEAIYGPSA